MIKIRLARGGRKKLPYYRILVTNSTSPRDSKFIEKIGTYNPLLKSDDENRINLDRDRAEYWLSVGAIPTERISKFLIELGVNGSEKHKPNYKPKAKGEGLKKKAQERIAKEKEAKEEAAAKAAEEAEKAKEQAAQEAQNKASEDVSKSENSAPNPAETVTKNESSEDSAKESVTHEVEERVETEDGESNQASGLTDSSKNQEVKA